MDIDSVRHLFASLTDDKFGCTLRTLCEFCYSNFDVPDLSNHSELRSLDEPKRNELCRLIKSNHLLMKRNLSLYAIGRELPLVVDSRWTSGLSVASNHLNTLNEPYVSIRFLTSRRKQVQVELNLIQLDRLISLLESAEHELKPID